MNGVHWLASYPKSGNTWLRLALNSVREGGAPVDLQAEEGWTPIAASRAIFDTMLEVESSDLTPEEAENLRPRFYEELARAATEPLLRKVHDAFTLTAAGETLFPRSVTLGAIYMVRDPRDVAVSFAHHRNQTIDRTIEAMANPQTTLAGSTRVLSPQLRQKLLTWSAHVDGWLDAPGLRRLVLRYEDMVSDPTAALLRVSRFIGWDIQSAVIEKAVEATRFDRLKAQEAEVGFRERSPESKSFFRRGIAGGWKDSLTAEQVASIERVHGPTMQRLDYRLSQ